MTIFLLTPFDKGKEHILIHSNSCGELQLLTTEELLSLHTNKSAIELKRYTY